MGKYDHTGSNLHCKYSNVLNCKYSNSGTQKTHPLQSVKCAYYRTNVRSYIKAADLVLSVCKIYDTLFADVRQVEAYDAIYLWAHTQMAGNIRFAPKLYRRRSAGVGRENDFRTVALVCMNQSTTASGFLA